MTWRWSCPRGCQMDEHCEFFHNCAQTALEDEPRDTSDDRVCDTFCLDQPWRCRELGYCLRLSRYARGG